MPTFQSPLGNETVTIHAPEPGSFDPEEFRQLFPSGAVYGLDVESVGVDFKRLAHFDADFRLRLVQFATTDYGYVLDLTDPDQRDAAMGLLSNETVAFCSHNDMDVLSVSVEFRIDITYRNVDTLVLATMVDPSPFTKKDLKSLSSTVLGVTELEEADKALDSIFTDLWVAQGGRRNAKREDVTKYGWTHIPNRDESYLRYAGLDAVCCRRLLDVLPAMTGAPRTLLGVEVWLAGVANRIKLRGFRIDMTAWRKQVEMANRETDAAIDEVADLTGGVRPTSPKIQQWLAEHGMDWDSWTGAMTPGGKPSIAKDNIFLLRDYDMDSDGKAVVEALIRHRKVINARVTADGISKKLVGDLIHPTLKTIGTYTGRMSGTEPNMQNVSKSNPEMRGMWVPDPGHTLIAADFKQIELRVAAAFSREDAMIQTIIDGGDLHQLVADQLGITRSLAKTVNFLILYGGGAKKLASQTKMTVEEAEQVVQRFWKTYPKMAELVREMKSLTSNVITVSGRRLPVPVFQGRPDTHKNFNYLVQSSARDALVHAWWSLDHIHGLGRYVWVPVHDELVLMVPDSEVDSVMEKVRNVMTFDFMGVPIEADVQKLLDRDGTSRWMSADYAEEIEKSLVKPNQ